MAILIEQKFSAKQLQDVSGLGEVCSKVLQSKLVSQGVHNPGTNLNIDGGNINRDVSVFGFFYEGGSVVSATAEKRAGYYDILVQMRGTPEKEDLFIEGRPNLDKHFSPNGTTH